MSTTRAKTDPLLGKRFRAVYADSNALWEVKRTRGRGVYVCEIVNEPIEYNGRMIDSDYAGTQKLFASEEIQQIEALEELLNKSAEKHEVFYQGLTLGSVVHYHHGFGQFIRCRVVVATGEDIAREEHCSVRLGETCLREEALVGAWRDYELRPGNYHVEGVKKGRIFRPHATNIFENPQAKSVHAHSNPAGLPALVSAGAS